MDRRAWQATVHGILQARILESVAIFFFRGSSQARNWTQVSCIVGGLFINWAILNCKQMFQGYSPAWGQNASSEFSVLLPLPLPLPVFLSEGNRHPRHKWSPPRSWPTGTRTQAQEAEGEAVALSCEGVPLLPPSRPRLRSRVSAVSLTTNGLAAVSHTANHPSLQSPPCSFITFVL